MRHLKVVQFAISVHIVEILFFEEPKRQWSSQGKKIKLPNFHVLFYAGKAKSPVQKSALWKESIICHSISMNDFHGKVIIITFTVNLQGTVITLAITIEAVGYSTRTQNPQIKPKLKHT